MRETVEQRLQKFRSISDSGCWEWTGTRHGFGYGLIRIKGKSIGCHRVAWELSNGPIPRGMFVCHKYDNPSCFNPSHLFLGTQKENVLDAISKGRMHFQNGGGFRRKINDRQKLEIINRRSNGEAASSIAKDFPVTQHQVQKICKQAGVMMKQKAWTAAQRAAHQRRWLQADGDSEARSRDERFSLVFSCAPKSDAVDVDHDESEIQRYGARGACDGFSSSTRAIGYSLGDSAFQPVMTPTTYKRLRLAIGTQAEAAKLLGVSRELIGLRERGQATITPEAALAIKAIKAIKPRMR